MWIFNNRKTQLALSEVVSPANQGTAVAASAAAAAQPADCTHTTLQPATKLVPVSGSLFHLDLCINVIPCLRYLSVVRSVSTVLVVANAECWWVWLQRWLRSVCIVVGCYRRATRVHILMKCVLLQPFTLAEMKKDFCLPSCWKFYLCVLKLHLLDPWVWALQRGNCC